MKRYLPALTRQMVAERAGFCCEYCRVAEADSYHIYHIEHIISRQHGGTDDPSNLAFSCSICNWKKGSNIGTILTPGGLIIPLFNPRTNNWYEHFRTENGEIVALTDIGAATVKILDLN